MAQTVKLPASAVNQAREEAVRQSRSLSAQVTHWMRIGRALERSPRFSALRVQAVLEGKTSPDTLAAEEQAVWFDAFHDELTDLSSLPDVKASYKALGDLAEPPAS